MSHDKETEDLLKAGRVETTPDADRRVMEKAKPHLRRPLWGPLAAAAALVVVALTPLFLPAEERGFTVNLPGVSEVARYTDQGSPNVGGAKGGAGGGGYYYGTAGGGGGGGFRLPAGPVEEARLLGAPARPKLDAVTNGLDDARWKALPAGDRLLHDRKQLIAGKAQALEAKRVAVLDDAPAAGVRFGAGAEGDVRGRTENLFDRALGRELTALPGTDLPGGHDTEQYDATVEQDFKDPRHEPLSTFSIDVDTASMANVRRFITAGRLPPRGAVRIEEMINYFTYDYPEPTGDQPFSVTTEVAACPWAPGHRLVHVGVQGKRISAEEIPPRNLVFLLDVSGSMRPGNKLPLVKAAMTLLIGQLRGEDRVAIVVYAGASGVVLEPTSGANSQAILAALDRLSAGGSTNGGAGIRLAYDLAAKNFEKDKINRVILATDGDFNVGTTSRDELHDLIEAKRKTGVFLTVLGVGTGNVKDSQMEMLADKGNGNYAYLDTLAEAQKVLVNEAGGTLVTIAKDVKIQVEFNPDKVGAYRLIGYDNRILAARDFNDDKKDAGEIGAGHSVTAIYEIVGPEGRENVVDPLKYQRPYVPGDRNYGDEILTAKLRYKKPDGDKSRLLEYPLKDPGERSFGSASRDFQFSAAVAAFGMLLKGSEHKGGASYGMVEELIHATLGDDPFGYRKALLDLVTKAKGLAAADEE